ncbi:MAG: AAA family ATPase [Bdellovibrionales bacterium]|nr:AAA family ATPase [Bdellovibrionales bacterium]
MVHSSSSEASSGDDESSSGLTPPGELPNPPIAEPDSEALPSGREENPFERVAVPGTSRVKQVWAIGGGKGGVGKSLVASSLAIALARMGNKVAAIDLDLGAANLHTALGVEPPKRTLSDFLTGQIASLGDCLSPSGVPNLDIISGAQDAVGVSNLPIEQKTRLLQQLRELDTDYVVFDLGAGTNFNTLDFFIYADIGIITLLPEPTSIENAYRFIKSIYYRRLKLSPKLRKVQHLIDAAMRGKGEHGIRTPADLFREVNKANPEAGMHLKAEIEKLRPKLVVNQARTHTDVDIGFSVKSVCKKYFGIEMDYVGYLDYDSAVWQAVRRKRPLMLEFPNSRLVSSIERISNYLVKRHGHLRNNFI